MNLKLEQLRVFVAVAESGSITDAAVQIGRTASAVSMTLRQIENQLDGKLFDGERKSRLTPLGSFTLKQAKPAVDSHRLAVQDIQRFARGEDGVTRIAVVPSVATRLLPRAIHQLRRKLPRLKADIRDIDSHAIHEEQVECGFGITILPELTQPNDRRISALPIDNLEMKRTLYTLKRRSVSLSPIDEHLIAAIRLSTNELVLSPNPI